MQPYTPMNETERMQKRPKECYVYIEKGKYYYTFSAKTTPFLFQMTRL